MSSAVRWLAGSVIGAVGLTGPVVGQTPSADPAAPEAVVIGPATPTPAPPTTDSGRGCEDVFKKVPPVRPLPRLGFFPILPTGPGYYSLADAVTGNYLDGPPKYPYPRFAAMPGTFFDNVDFRYLDDPKNTETDVFDPLKRVRVGDDWLFSTGGTVWNRSMNEYNSRLTEQDNVYNLTRVRAYGDLWYRDLFRVYAEFIGAYSNFQDLPPLPIDVNRADFLNLFLDLKVAELGGKPAYVRVGRQELVFGSQRLVSPLDWANTRRTFQGVRGFRQGEKVDVDLFWVKPVIANPGELDSWDDEQNFAGVWTTTKLSKSQALDLYYLYLDNGNRVTQQAIVRSPFVLNTIGGRYVGDVDNRFLWDFEGGVQLGSRGPENVIAGFATAGLGYHPKDVPLNPTFWMYYDYASGDDRPNQGTFHTFNQLFPFGHYYMGWADLVGRQNIHDFNLHLYLYPAKWVTVWFQFHRFWLDAPRDALYNPAGVATRRDPTGRAGTDVGREFDTVLNFHLTKHADILTGYSHLFGGDFLRRTAGPNAAVDASVFFVQFNYRW